jgi:hypothetical protein
VSSACQVASTESDVIVISDEGEALALSGTRSGGTVTITLTEGTATGMLTRCGRRVHQRDL